MTTSTTEKSGEIDETVKEVRGSFADGLTLVRVILAVIVAAAIIFGWPTAQWAVLASVIFAFGALTDFFDDLIGGPQRASARMFGWFDDIADAVLIGAALIAMLYVTYKGGVLAWGFAVPALVYVGRDLLVGAVKGFEFSKKGAPKNRLGDIKNFVAMLGVSLMIAAPWLQLLIDRTLAGTDPEKLRAIYDSPSPWVWMVGQGLLWLAALLAIITMVQHFTRKPAAANEA